MNETTNYHLKKPEETDFYDVGDFNYNADLIDGELSNLENNTTRIQNSGGGFSAGYNTDATTGSATGRGAWTTTGVAAGYLAYAANGGSATGEQANADAGGAAGAGAKAGAGFAGGKDAKAVDSSGSGIDAIQLGTGTNSTAKTLQVYGHRLMDANGNIPVERLTNVPQVVEEIEVTTNDILMADELDHFTCGMEECRTAVIKQHFITETTGEGVAYGNAMFITVESNTATYNGIQDGHPFLTQTLYYGPGIVYTRDGEPSNTGSPYTWGYWELLGDDEGGISDAPSDGNTYARKDGAWANMLDTSDSTRTNYQLINFIIPDAPGSGVDNTNLDDLPNGITIVGWHDGQGVGGYMVITMCQYNYGNQIKIAPSGISRRYNNGGTWNEWSKIS